MELHRPYIRNWVRDATEADAQRAPDGRFLDVNKKTPIDGPYDLGHRAGHEFRAEKTWAQRAGLTQKEFNDWMNDPAFYQIEEPAYNRSHEFEAPPDLRSRAEQVYDTQGVRLDARGRRDDTYPGHDNVQNGVIPQNQPTTIYFSSWEADGKGSGYFTDQATVDSCVHNGVLDANQLGDKLQTAKSDYYGDYEARPHCTAYDVDWNRLEALKSENPGLYRDLTNHDGWSPDNGGIKCAYGKCEANTQHGAGGGNQYYIPPDTFNRAVDAGVFRKNPGKSFGEDQGNLQRQTVEKTPEREEQYDRDKLDVARAEAQKPQKTPEQLQAAQVEENPKQPYIARPDPAYSPEKIQSRQQPEEKTAPKPVLEQKTDQPVKNPEPDKKAEREKKTEPTEKTGKDNPENDGNVQRLRGKEETGSAVPNTAKKDGGQDAESAVPNQGARKTPRQESGDGEGTDAKVPNSSHKKDGPERGTRVPNRGVEQPKQMEQPKENSSRVPPAPEKSDDGHKTDSRMPNSSKGTSQNNNDPSGSSQRGQGSGHTDGRGL